MMKAKKKKPEDRRRPVEMSQKQLERHIHNAVEEAVSTTGILYSTVLVDKYGWTEDQVAQLYEDISRYLEYIDNKVLRLREVAAILEKKTGIKMKCRW